MNAGFPLSFATSNPEDNEERIEHELLRDAFLRLVDGVVITDHVDAEGTVAFGRIPEGKASMGRYAWPTGEDFSVPYWQWPQFIQHAHRDFLFTDFSGAEAEVQRLHASGRDAFVKACRRKFMALKVPQGASLVEAIEDYVYSFIDLPPCLMVQEFRPMEFEYRLMVVDGRAVTGAGCVPKHTPLDNEALFDPKMARTPKGEVEHCHERLTAYLRFAEAVIPTLPMASFTLDVAMIDGKVGIVEMDPLVPGRFGLYASDVDALVNAVVPWVIRETLERGRMPEERPTPPPRPEVISEEAWVDNPLLSSVLQMRKSTFGF